MTKKPIYLVTFAGGMGIAAQPFKAIDEDEAIAKWTKMFPKKTKEDHFIDCSEIEVDSKLFSLFKSQAK